MEDRRSTTHCSNCERLWDVIDRLEAKVDALMLRVRELENENAEVKAEHKKLAADNRNAYKHIAALQQENEQLQQKLAEAEKKGTRQTSRFPRKDRKKNPKKAGRKKGSDPTHRERPPSDKVDRRIDVPAGPCPDCCCNVENITVHEQLQTDLPPVMPVATPFNVEVGTCPQCGRRVQGHDPEQVSDALGAAANVIGPNTQTMAAQLKHQAGISDACESGNVGVFPRCRHSCIA